ncbi:MAG: hypothetical protein RL653_398 [Pseudomonadota bacterium]|jgi:hypothetical protein
MAISGWDHPVLPTSLKRRAQREQQQAAEERDRRARLKRTPEEEAPAHPGSGPSAFRD